MLVAFKKECLSIILECFQEHASPAPPEPVLLGQMELVQELRPAFFFDLQEMAFDALSHCRPRAVVQLPTYILRLLFLLYIYCR